MSGVEPSGEFEKGKLFVGGVSHQTSEEDFRAYFSRFGTVKESKINMDHNTQRPKGFGFVTFEKEEDVEHVLSCPEHILSNKKIDPKRAQAKNVLPIKAVDCKVFVGGIPPIEGDTVEENPNYVALISAMRSAMEGVSKNRLVCEVDIKCDPDKKKHKGFGFITFQSPAEAQDAVREHHVIVLGKEVEIKKAEPKMHKNYYAPAAQQQFYSQQQWQPQAQRYSGSNNYYPASEYGSSYGYGQSSGFDQTMYQAHAGGSANSSGYDYHYSTPHSEHSGYAHGQGSYGQYHHSHPQQPPHQQQYSYHQQAAPAPQAHSGYGGGQQQAATGYAYGHQHQMTHNPHHHSS